MTGISRSISAIIVKLILGLNVATILILYENVIWKISQFINYLKPLMTKSSCLFLPFKWGTCWQWSYMQVFLYCFVAYHFKWKTHSEMFYVKWLCILSWHNFNLCTVNCLFLCITPRPNYIIEEMPAFL